MLYTDDDIARVKEAVPLVEVVRGYVELRRTGKDWKGLCPLHSEKTPSFVVHEQYFKCHGCGKAGDVFTFLQEIEGKRFSEVVQDIAQRYGVTLDGQHLTRQQQHAAVEMAAECAVFWDAVHRRTLRLAWDCLACGRAAERAVLRDGLEASSDKAWWFAVVMPEAAEALHREADYIEDADRALLFQAFRHVRKIYPRLGIALAAEVAYRRAEDGVMRGIEERLREVSA